MSFWNSEATLHVIDGADHMYLGEIDDLENIINDFIGMNQF
jgi:alpha/beta superfamily hydrolase